MTIYAKGTVESGVKYVKRNFLPGRTFRDQADFEAPLAEWNAPVADVRVHGTPHARPLDRFERERAALLPTAGQPGFRLQAPLPRSGAEDSLVSFETNRYSVPFPLIGQPGEVQRHGAERHSLHRGRPVAVQPLLAGKHQLRILPEPGPGAMARTARRRVPTPLGPGAAPARWPEEVEVRDLTLYEQLLSAEGAP